MRKFFSDLWVKLVAWYNTKDTEVTLFEVEFDDDSKKFTHKLIIDMYWVMVGVLIGALIYKYLF